MSYHLILSPYLVTSPRPLSRLIKGETEEKIRVTRLTKGDKAKVTRLSKGDKEEENWT